MANGLLSEAPHRLGGMPVTKQTHCKRGHEFTDGSFYVSKHADGRTYRQCRACANAYGKAAYHAMTPDQRRQRNASFPSRAKVPQYMRKYRYGISHAEYVELLISQDGLCMICTTEGATHVDHDHETGKVRGILCGPCNRAIGLFKEDPDALAFAAEYVKGVA